MWNKGSEVFTNLKNRFPQSLKDKYQSLNFTNLGNENEESKFPQIYFHPVSAVEIGQDLTGTTINGALFTFQIEVMDNESNDRVDEVMSAVINVMKGMLFSMNQFPQIQNTSSTYKTIARFTRTIGAGDVL